MSSERGKESIRRWKEAAGRLRSCRLVPQHTKFREKQTGHAIRYTRHMAMREDTTALDVVNPPQQPRAVLSDSRLMVSLPRQVHQMFKVRHVGMLGLWNKEVLER